MYLQNDIGATQSIDPWGGSYYVESLTDELTGKAWELIQEIEAEGGMTSAIEAGIPKMRIEEAAASKQASIDAGQEILVGVNAFNTEKNTELNLLEVDNTAVRAAQIDLLQQIRANRDNKKSKRGAGCNRELRAQ